MNSSQRCGVKFCLQRLGMLQQRLAGLQGVGAQVGQLAQLHPPAQVGALLGVGDGDALVQPVVGQLLEVLGADVVVGPLPVVGEVAEVEGAEVDVSRAGDHPQHRQRPIAQPLVGVGAPLALQLHAPGQQPQTEQRQEQLDPDRGLVVPVGPQGLGSDRRRRLLHPHLAGDGRGQLAEGLHLGDRIEAVALPLAEAQVADQHPAQRHLAAAQAVHPLGRLDPAQVLVAVAVDRAPDGVVVVGVALHPQGPHRHHLTEVPGQHRGAGLEHGRQRGVPDRALVGHHAVGRPVDPAAADVRPVHRALARQQVAGRAGAARGDRRARDVADGGAAGGLSDGRRRRTIRPQRPSRTAAQEAARARPGAMHSHQVYLLSPGFEPGAAS